MDMGLYIQGVVLGLGAAMPIGPINIEIIRRGLTRGFAPAFALGLGACSADMVYLSLVLLGLTRWAGHPAVQTAVWLAGGGLLIYLAILAAKAARRGQFVSGEPKRGGTSGPRSYLTGLAMTLTNPMTIVFWTTVSAMLSGRGFAWNSYGMSLAGVFTGTAGWVVSISSLSAAGRRWVGPRVLAAVNVAGALLLGGFGVYSLLRAAGMA